MLNRGRLTGFLIVMVGLISLVRVWYTLVRERHEPGSSRLLLVINQYATPHELPGYARHFELGMLIARLGWQMQIFASGFNHNQLEFVRSVTVRHSIVNEEASSVQFSWLYTLPYRENDWRRYISMLVFCSLAVTHGISARQPDAVLGSSPHLFSGLAAWVLARWHRVPFVLEVRDMWPDSLIAMGMHNKLVIMPLRWLEAFLYRRADSIIVLSAGIDERIRAKGIPARKLILIPNLPKRPLPRDDERRRLLRERLGWHDQIVVIYAGAHGPANALDTIVEAARLLGPDAKVLFAFLGGGSAKGDLIDLAAGLSHVVFLNPVPQGEVLEYLHAADIGLLTLRETDVFRGVRPNKLFEYMAARLPIVSSVQGEAATILQNSGAGIVVPPESPAAIADTVLQLATDRDLREVFAMRGLMSLSQSGSREDTASQLVAMLDQLLPLDIDSGASNGEPTVHDSMMRQ